MPHDPNDLAREVIFNQVLMLESNRRDLEQAQDEIARLHGALAERDEELGRLRSLLQENSPVPLPTEQPPGE